MRTSTTFLSPPLSYLPLSSFLSLIFISPPLYLPFSSFLSLPLFSFLSPIFSFLSPPGVDGVGPCNGCRTLPWDLNHFNRFFFKYSLRRGWIQYTSQELSPKEIRRSCLWGAKSVVLQSYFHCSIGTASASKSDGFHGQRFESHPEYNL